MGVCFKYIRGIILAIFAVGAAPVNATEINLINIWNGGYVTVGQEPFSLTGNKRSFKAKVKRHDAKEIIKEEYDDKEKKYDETSSSVGLRLASGYNKVLYNKFLIGIEAEVAAKVYDVYKLQFTEEKEVSVQPEIDAEDEESEQPGVVSGLYSEDNVAGEGEPKDAKEKKIKQNISQNIRGKNILSTGLYAKLGYVSNRYIVYGFAGPEFKYGTFSFTDTNKYECIENCGIKNNLEKEVTSSYSHNVYFVGASLGVGFDYALTDKLFLETRYKFTYSVSLDDANSLLHEENFKYKERSINQSHSINVSIGYRF
ncbi:outer membrane protein [Bartonella sp. DGB1]|uniref:outer membrane protein n=1 Tax=Bartonella sp. DGB1 TaxID=3239807 RepID=UPI0035258297